LAIPLRPQLPNFLNPAAAAGPAAPAAAPAMPGASPQKWDRNAPDGWGGFGSADGYLAWNQKRKTDRRQALADTQGWANFQRRAYGLPETPQPPQTAPTQPANFVGWLNQLSTALKPAGGQQYDFPLLQQLLGSGIPIPQLPGS
jgi:hypothetical protein